MKKVMKSRSERIRKRKLTSDIVLEKLNSIIQRLDTIERDLREIKKVVSPKSDLEEKESTPEFFIQK